MTGVSDRTTQPSSGVAAAFSRYLTIPRHGRRLARLRDGTILLLQHDPSNGTSLLALRAGVAPYQTTDPAAAVKLPLPIPDALRDPTDPDPAGLAAIILDRDDRAHLVWSSGQTVGHARV